MEQKLARAVDVLDALDSYFISLTDYLKETDREKFVRLERAFTECRGYKRKFAAIKLDDDGLFQAVHLHAQVRCILENIYRQLDFQLPVGEEISKTRAYRMTEVFNKITTVYRTYIRDVAAESGAMVEEAAAQLKTSDPLELQRFWQHWPEAIELYMIAQTRSLDQSYRDKDTARRQQIFEILETDKRFIIGETEWISPFLTYNCVPWVKTPQPVAWLELAALLGVSGGADPVEAAEEAGEESKEEISDAPKLPKKPELIDGAIIVRREQGASVTHLLPTALEWGPGIVESDIHETLIPTRGGAWHWSIKVHDTPQTERYYIFETLGHDQWRVLVPWRYARADLSRDLLVHKIKTAAFGRPAAYHNQIEQALRQTLSKRVAVISTEEARSHDVSLSVLHVTAQLLARVKKSRGGVEARIADDELDHIFESEVLIELSKQEPTLLDAVLYWVSWSRQNFRRDLDSAVERAEFAEGAKWDIVVENRVEKCIHDAVDMQLRKASNVFKDLFDKQHKINEVHTHTRRAI